MNVKSAILSAIALSIHLLSAQPCFNSVEELDATLELFYQGGRNAGIEEVIDAPASFGLVSRSAYDAAYNQRFQEGFLAGESSGIQQVQGAPSDYGLYTKSQYDANRSAGWSEGYSQGQSAGILQVTASPSSYSLYTATQYNQNRQAGRSDVTSDPESYGLIASDSLSTEIHLAMKNLIRTQPSAGDATLEAGSMASGVLYHSGDGVLDQLAQGADTLTDGRMAHFEFDLQALRTAMPETAEIASAALLLELGNSADAGVELHWYARDGDGVIDSADALTLTSDGGGGPMTTFIPNPVVNGETQVDVQSILTPHVGGSVRLILHQLGGEYEYFSFRTGASNSPFLEITTATGVQRIDPLRKGSYYRDSFYGDTDEAFDFINQVSTSARPTRQSWGIIDFDLANISGADIQSAFLKLISSGGSFAPSVGIVATNNMNALPEAAETLSFQPPASSGILNLGGKHVGPALLSGASLASKISGALASGDSHVAVSLLNLSGHNLMIGTPAGQQSAAVLLVNAIDVGPRIDAAIDAGIELVRNQPGDYDLLREDEILDQRTPGLVMELKDNLVRLRLPIEISDNLSEWQDSGTSIEADLPVETDIKTRFYRLRLSPAAGQDQ